MCSCFLQNSFFHALRQSRLLSFCSEQTQMWRKTQSTFMKSTRPRLLHRFLLPTKNPRVSFHGTRRCPLCKVASPWPLPAPFIERCPSRLIFCFPTFYVSIRCKCKNAFLLTEAFVGDPQSQQRAAERKQFEVPLLDMESRWAALRNTNMCFASMHLVLGI